MGRPGLQESAIHQEVLISEQRLGLWGTHQLLQEAPHHMVIEEPLAVLGKRGGVPDRIVGAQPYKPAEQQVVVQLLQYQPLGANPVERLQQRGK